MPEQRCEMSEELLYRPSSPVSGLPPAEVPPPPSAAAAAAAATEGPLDLTTRSAGSTTDPLAMDLSLPDKDSPVEACYTCGTSVRRSTLHALLVLRRHRYGDEPFFPSLLEHSRSAGSWPMTPDGRVNVCTACARSLMGQWDGYQKENKVVPGRRSYAVQAGSGPPLGEFVCYMCCLTYSVACRIRLRVAPAPGGEPFHPDVLRPATPPGAEGVRAGTVAVCINCKRKAAVLRALQQGRPLPADSHCYRIIEETVRDARSHPPPVEPATSTFESIRVRRLEVVCLWCRGTHQREFMAEVRFSSADPARAHFPALALQPRPPGVVVCRGGALVCLQCCRALQKQWLEYEARGAPLADRVYAMRRGSCGSGSDARRAPLPPPAASPKPMSLVAPSTVTAGCYACHQPLEANRAYEVRTEPSPADASAPFFPHLAQQRHLPAPVSSVAVCVFCYHTLADQWARYERLSRKIDPYRREYDTHNFICFVCSVRTYRKRLHVIDVKDFPFLTASHRYPEGALLICNRTKSVVCRDCHGTLNCQFQDYERWNLPVSKREYNWVTRPPPPESPEPIGRPDTVIVRYVAA
ncbi:uncharacterized protein LOC119105349 [Pollicipes pollicipes]|uniref:uncharacterized protein LOC119105349 n=1 Tax=Pollicipes pollicipes TaxID=41117 RepID=UPI001884A3E1|nr:uncharacterized protein LOC119105349 [Pollicipes pollicipes]